MKCEYCPEQWFDCEDGLICMMFHMVLKHGDKINEKTNDTEWLQPRKKSRGGRYGNYGK